LALDKNAARDRCVFRADPLHYSGPIIRGPVGGGERSRSGHAEVAVKNHAHGLRLVNGSCLNDSWIRRIIFFGWATISQRILTVSDPSRNASSRVSTSWAIACSKLKDRSTVSTDVFKIWKHAVTIQSRYGKTP